MLFSPQDGILFVKLTSLPFHVRQCRKQYNKEKMAMKFYFAPLEGITDYVFRRIHSRHFPGLDKYFTPFLSPTQDGRFPRRALRDVLSEKNAGLPVVPQLLTRHAADFLWAARQLADLGYPEVNLNLGCPSGTVVAKGKGSGMLADPAALERFLDEIFIQSPIPISIKTRLGMKDPEEFFRLLEIYNRYPVRELTVHARVRADFYRVPARPDAFAWALAHSENPVCCNGDLTTPTRLMEFQTRFSQAPAAMLGRGLVADPALVRRVQGGPAADRDALRRYHDDLLEGYSSAFGSLRNALGRMKEIWFYHSCLFENGESYFKKLRKTTDPAEYQSLTDRIFAELPLRTEGALPRW